MDSIPFAKLLLRSGDELELLKNWGENEHGDATLDEVGSEGEEEGKEEVEVGLAGAELVEMVGGVVDEDVGDRDLRIKQYTNACDVDIGWEGADYTG